MLSNSTWRRIDEFFLKKEENNTHLYLAKIVKPFDIIKALISKQETTKKTNMNGDETSEESSSSCCLKRHGLSRVGRIEAFMVNRSEVELMSEMMAFITASHQIVVRGEDCKVYDAELTESLLRGIQVTHKLKELRLWRINVTSSPAVEFIDNAFKKAPNLEFLDMSFNPLLGAGVDSLIKHLSCAPHLEKLWLQGVKMTPQQVKDLSSAIKQRGNITKLWSSYHDDDGNPKPEHEWPSEDFWRREYPWLFSHSSNESQTQKQQIPAETRLSIHDSPFFAHEQDTVRTFPASPDPTADPMLAGPSIRTAHGPSHGLTLAATYSGNPLHNVLYPQHYPSPDIYTYHHSAPSTIFTPGGSLGYDSYVFRGSDLSSVTQDEPERDTCPSIQEVPSHDSGTAVPVPLPLHSAGAPTPTSHFPLHSLAPFSEHPLRYGTLEPPLQAWQPRSTIPGYLHPRSSGISFSPQYGFHPQSASPSYPHLQFSDPVTSAVTHTPVIPGNRTRAPLQAPQPLSASSGDLHLSGPVTSSVTHPVVIPAGYSYAYGNHMRAPLQAPLLQSASPGDPHHSDPMSSVIHPPVIPGYSSYPYGNRMRAPLLAPQPQSASSGVLLVSGHVTPSVTHPQVIPGYSYPYGNHMRAPLLAPQPQSASPGDLHLSGIPGYSYPYGNRMRAPLLAPQPQSASPGDPHLSGPISSVIHPPVIPGFLSLSGMQRGSPEVQHEPNPSTESGTWPSQ